METLLAFILFAVVVALVIGLIKPDLVLQWKEEDEATRKNVLKYYGLASVGLLLIVGLVMDSDSVNNPDVSDVQENVEEVVENNEADNTSTDVENNNEQTWQEVSSWSGTGIKSTEPFRIEGSQWRINHSFDSSMGNGGVFQVYVYNPGSDLPVTVAANSQGSTSDSSYVYESGQFYLEINSANGNWSVSVEELK